MSLLRRTLRRLTASDAELHAAELADRVAESGAVPCAAARTGEPVCVTGRLRSVVSTPRANLPTVEAELYDGTAAITLMWLGRRRIAGVEPGRRVVARGRLARRDGRLVIYNPAYTLQAEGHR